MVPQGSPETVQEAPRSWVGRSALAGMVLLGVAGTVGGATGLIRSEYRQGPGVEAILGGYNGAGYGLAIGAVVGLAVTAFRRWRWRRRPQAQGPKR
jgi:O-antigen ligase